MSKLKVYQVICTDDIDRNEITENFSAPDFLAYDADEADKVIAELKNEIEVQKRLRDMALASVPNALKVMKIIQHQKYKRCLAMAGRCRLRARWFGDNAFYKKEQWALKWHKRWLELAEKYKPNNSTAQ